MLGSGPLVTLPVVKMTQKRFEAGLFNQRAYDAMGEPG